MHCNNKTELTYIIEISYILKDQLIPKCIDKVLLDFDWRAKSTHLSGTSE